MKVLGTDSVVAESKEDYINLAVRWNYKATQHYSDKRYGMEVKMHMAGTAAAIAQAYATIALSTPSKEKEVGEGVHVDEVH